MLESLKFRLKLFFTLKSEKDRLSKFENTVEGLGLYFLIVYLVFRLIYLPAEVSLMETVLRTIVLIYICVIGPFLHKNPPNEIGLGDFKHLKVDLFNRKHPAIIVSMIVLILLSILVFPLFINQFNTILKLVPLIGELNDYVAISVPWFQIPLAVIEYVLFQIFLIFLLIRKDNLWGAFKSMGKQLLILLCVLLILSLISLKIFNIQGGFFDFLSIWYGYTFWGMMQQIPFLVYFSARFRNGFPYKRGSEYVNIGLLAFFFAFFHGTQWLLVIMAILMEIILARSFLHDETRNLFVAAFIHGLLGTTIFFFTNLSLLVDYT